MVEILRSLEESYIGDAIDERLYIEVADCVVKILERKR